MTSYNSWPIFLIGLDKCLFCTYDRFIFNHSDQGYTGVLVYTVHIKCVILFYSIGNSLKLFHLSTCDTVHCL